MLEDFGKETLNLRPTRVGSLDVIGNAYEYLIKHFAAGSGKSAGEFYTPPEVSDLLSILLEPQQGDSICDPACGSGSLLMKCGKQVQNNYAGSKQYALFGQEAIGSTWSLAKMNMFLHGEDNHRIEWGDTIRNPKLQDKEGGLMHFDVVTANPPFSLDKWGFEDASNDHFGRFRRGIPPKTKGDYAFISHMIETLKPQTGRMGVVVPHGVLFRASSEGKIRKQLIDENLLDTVIGLPEKLFLVQVSLRRSLSSKNTKMITRYCLLMRLVSSNLARIKTSLRLRTSKRLLIPTRLVKPPTNTHT
ncbi:type I restriction-modification system [Vibrio sp. JCM 19236]|nr:type I restriction-modification system [Vibrio sp. JCM 19236]